LTIDPKNFRPSTADNFRTRRAFENRPRSFKREQFCASFETTNLRFDRIFEELIHFEVGNLVFCPRSRDHRIALLFFLTPLDVARASRRPPHLGFSPRANFWRYFRNPPIGRWFEPSGRLAFSHEFNIPKDASRRAEQDVHLRFVFKPPRRRVIREKHAIFRLYELFGYELSTYKSYRP